MLSITRTSNLSPCKIPTNTQGDIHNQISTTAYTTQPFSALGAVQGAIEGNKTAGRVTVLSSKPKKATKKASRLMGVVE